MGPNDITWAASIIIEISLFVYVIYDEADQHISDNGAGRTELSCFGGLENDEYNCLGFLEIYTIYKKQCDIFFWLASHFKKHRTEFFVCS